MFSSWPGRKDLENQGHWKPQEHTGSSWWVFSPWCHGSLLHPTNCRRKNLGRMTGKHDIYLSPPYSSWLRLGGLYSFWKQTAKPIKKILLDVPPILDEKRRRVLFGSAAEAMGHGGIALLETIDFLSILILERTPSIDRSLPICIITSQSLMSQSFDCL